MNRTDRISRWIANRLPARTVYFATIRLGAFATTGKFSSTVVPDLTLMDGLKRWENQHLGRGRA